MRTIPSFRNPLRKKANPRPEWIGHAVHACPLQLATAYYRSMNDSEKLLLNGKQATFETRATLLALAACVDANACPTGDLECKV
jgi:hypothetical protein